MVLHNGTVLVQGSLSIVVRSVGDRFCMVVHVVVSYCFLMLLHIIVESIAFGVLLRIGCRTILGCCKTFESLSLTVQVGKADVVI